MKKYFLILLGLVFLSQWQVLARAQANEIKPAWTYSESNTEIYSPEIFGEEVAYVKKFHWPDGHDAESYPSAYFDKLRQRAKKEPRFGDPRVVIHHLKTGKVEEVDYGWDPQLSKDEGFLVYAKQIKPMAGLRQVASSFFGNSIVLFDRKNNKSLVLAQPKNSEIYFSKPVFSIDQKKVIFELNAKANGAWGAPVGVSEVRIKDKKLREVMGLRQSIGLYHLAIAKFLRPKGLYFLEAIPKEKGTHFAKTYQCELKKVGQKTPVFSLESKNNCPAMLEISDKEELWVYDQVWKQKIDKSWSPLSCEVPGYLSPDKKRLITDTLEVYDFNDCKKLFSLKTPLKHQVVRQVKFSQNDNRVLVLVSEYKEAPYLGFVKDHLMIFDID